MQEDAVGCLEADDRDFSDTHTGHPGIMGYKVVTRDSGIGDYAHESLQMIVDSPVRI